MKLMKFDDPKTWPATWKGCCTIVSQDMTWTNRDTGETIRRTPEEVFESNPHGELMFVHEWFIDCLISREVKARLAAGESTAEIDSDIAARAESEFNKLIGLHHGRVRQASK